MTELLDCGHAAPILPPGHVGGTGYGEHNGKTHCYACCADLDRAEMIKTGRATLYLVKRLPKDATEPYAFRYWVTNWPGSLSFPCLHMPGTHEGARRSKRGGGFGSQRTDAWFTGPDGYVWHAINRGDMDIACCRRTKVKA